MLVLTFYLIDLNTNNFLIILLHPKQKLRKRSININIPQPQGNGKETLLNIYNIQ